MASPSAHPALLNANGSDSAPAPSVAEHRLNTDPRTEPSRNHLAKPCLPPRNAFISGVIGDAIAPRDGYASAGSSGEQLAAADAPPGAPPEAPPPEAPPPGAPEGAPPRACRGACSGAKSGKYPITATDRFALNPWPTGARFLLPPLGSARAPGGRRRAPPSPPPRRRPAATPTSGTARARPPSDNERHDRPTTNAGAALEPRLYLIL